jgi:NAD(P)-dependent dehydrogenase (short-subunit alcohol dehydrogenase family)
MMIQDRTALVTGASGGIGSALVDHLLGAGIARVLACDLNTDALSLIGRRSPERITAFALDVTDEGAVVAAAEKYPDVDMLINCHGVAVQQSYLEVTSLRAFRHEMEVNYWGQVLMCRAFAAALSRPGGRALVNVLSPLAHVTLPFVAPYCATKAACRALTDAMRAELASAGTLVMAVYPGSIDTPMMTHVNVPKSSPATVARAVVAGLREGLQEVWAGEGSEEMRAMLQADPAGLFAAAAKQLRLSDVNAAGTPVASGALNAGEIRTVPS